MDRLEMIYQKVTETHEDVRELRKEAQADRAVQAEHATRITVLEEKDKPRSRRIELLAGGAIAIGAALWAVLS